MKSFHSQRMKSLKLQRETPRTLSNSSGRFIKPKQSPDSPGWRNFSNRRAYYELEVQNFVIAIVLASKRSGCIRGDRAWKRSISGTQSGINQRRLLFLLAHLTIFKTPGLLWRKQRKFEQDARDLFCLEMQLFANVLFELRIDHQRLGSLSSVNTTNERF